MSRKLTPIPSTLLIKIFEADGFSVVRRKRGSYHYDEKRDETAARD
jgi:predicted RNA binding protein YcfA (HicA-like mRNA interferase family)